MTGSRARTSVTLHSSWSGIVASVLAGVIIAGLGLFGATRGGWRSIPILVLALGVVLILIALLDYPVASTFDRNGVRRRMILRHQDIPWERVRQLTRERPRLIRGFRSLRLGGLAAVVGRRRYLLVDQPESGDEHDALEEALGDRAAELELELVGRPDSEVTPTWAYRRRRWCPTSEDHR